MKDNILTLRCEININTTKVIKMAEKSNTYGDKSCKIPPEGEGRSPTLQEKLDLWQDRILIFLMIVMVFLIIPMGLVGMGILLVKMFRYFMELIA